MIRSIAILKLPRSVGGVITFARSVESAMNGNPYFPSPTPTLAVFQADVDALASAEATVLTRQKGARDARDAELVVVRSDLGALCGYVQRVADENATVADLVIETAGLSVRRYTHRDKPALAVKQTLVSGVVHLFAKCAGDRAAYRWQYRETGGAWVLPGHTLQSRTTMSGLTPGMRYDFCVQVLTKDGVGDFSAVVSIVVT